MTCREKLMQEHPECVNDCYIGGCDGCPCDRGYMDEPSWCHDKGATEGWCRKCWDREIPDTVVDATVTSKALDTIAHPIVITDEHGNEHPVLNPPLSDAVNHPSHYNHGMECIEEMLLVFGNEATMHFCLLNAWKYRKRAIHKNGEEDMKKADWYIAKYHELKGGKNVR